MQTTITPAIEHYRAFKAKYPDYILLFRRTPVIEQGDFYEMYEDDASTAHRVLGLNLMVGKTGETYNRYAGFPAEYVDAYTAKLVKAGLRVAICEPAE